jgi:CheY-like chemotaxis protein
MYARILITMEHAQQAQLICDSLEHYGYSIVKANTFHSSMEVLRASDVDLIISDVPLQNGGSVFDFLRWVKGDPHLRNVPFVCFSAEPPEIGKYLQDGVRTAARSLGADRYIMMEHFDANAFRHEIEWLLPLKNAGSYYAQSTAGVGSGDGDGH